MEGEEMEGEGMVDERAGGGMHANGPDGAARVALPAGKAAMAGLSALAVRAAVPEDAAQLLEIYAPYVTDTAVSFEYEPPTVREFGDRIRQTLERYPYLAAEAGGRILGYAYAGPFKSRAAYDWAVETTVYVRRECRGGGVGRALYLALEEVLARQHILNTNACISVPSGHDVHLTDGSERFHRSMGYRKVAHFTRCGFKFRTWYDMIWMEKLLGEHGANPRPFIPFPDLPPFEG